MMNSSSLSTISRRFMQLAIRPAVRKNNNTPACSMVKATSKSSFTSAMTTIRTFSSGEGGGEDAGNNQKQWDEWQQNLFQGENEDTRRLKKRGGKVARKREAIKKLSTENANRLIDAGTGQFPPLRYSDEETERLLAEAYAGIPKRMGKRGTRSFKRQKVRFYGIRKARSIKKAEKIAHHFKRMEIRSKKAHDIRKMKEIAVETRKEDKAYQMQVLKKWGEMNGLISSAVSATSGDDSEVAKQEV